MPCEVLESFWKAQQGEPWFESCKHLLGDLSRCVPIYLHGDDAESHRRRSFCVTTFGSVLTCGASWDTKMVISVTDNNCMTDNSHAVLDTWTAWSLQELLSGVWSTTDPWGRPLNRPGKQGHIAGGFTAALVLHKGDEAYLCKTYRTTTTWSSVHPCLICKAWAAPTYRLQARVS